MRTIKSLKDWFELFAEYCGAGDYENARVATRMIDSQLQRFREQFDKIEINNNDNENKMEENEIDEEEEIRRMIEHNRKIQVLDVPPTTDELDLPFKMVVDQAYWIEAKQGYLLTGKITGGGICPDDKITLSNGLKAKVKEFDNGSDYVCAFDTNVGILITGIKKGALDGVENLIAE